MTIYWQFIKWINLQCSRSWSKIQAGLRNSVSWQWCCMDWSTIGCSVRSSNFGNWNNMWGGNNVISCNGVSVRCSDGMWGPNLWGCNMGSVWDWCGVSEMDGWVWRVLGDWSVSQWSCVWPSSIRKNSSALGADEEGSENNCDFHFDKIWFCLINYINKLVLQQNPISLHPTNNVVRQTALILGWYLGFSWHPLCSQQVRPHQHHSSPSVQRTHPPAAGRIRISSLKKWPRDPPVGRRTP